MTDLLELAGGAASVMAAAAVGVSETPAPPAHVLRVGRYQCLSALGVNLARQLEGVQQLRALMGGERPRGPSDATDAWDDALATEIEDALRAQAEVFGVPFPKWELEHQEYDIHSERAWATLGAEFAEFVWRERIETKDSTAKQLAAFGLGGKDLAPAAPAVEQPALPFDLGAWGRALAAEDGVETPDVAAVREAARAAHDAAAGGKKESGASKGRGRKRAHVALTLPGTVFTTLRDVGTSLQDKGIHEASGIQRSTVSRVASGTQTEIGVSAEEFAKLLAFAEAKLAEVQSVVSTLELWSSAP